jgi:serine/threonine protein kinase
MADTLNHLRIAGYLYKKGGKNPAYRKRWFELHDNYLLYYKQVGDKRPKGVIIMDATKVDKCRTEKGKHLVIQISGPRLKRDFHLETENEMDFSLWLTELQEASKITTARRRLREEKISLDSFEITRAIGRGYFSIVLHVVEKVTEKPYALKVVNKHLLNKNCLVRRSFLCDINHPYIVRLNYAFQSSDKLFLAMDFLAGGSLKFHLQRGEIFSMERAKFYAAEILLAIEYLHEQNIAYRDLRSENVMINRDGHICLTEFGLARTEIIDNTSTYLFMGSPEYFAPEILRLEGHDKRADWWSFGILLYEMFVGVPPFVAQSATEILDMIKNFTPTFPNIVRKDARALIISLLRDDALRLRDATTIKKHVFFSDIDWEAFSRKEVSPPWIPQLQDDEFKYFDELPSNIIAEVSTEYEEAFNVEGFELNDGIYL